MRIAEIYQSIQGEGFLTGTASVFVRASGCNLRCWYCDTPFASWQPEGDDWGIEEILQQVATLGASHVVLTGGEPMLFAELVPLCEGLRRQERHITIETAGTLYLPLFCDLMSISPKLSNSAPASATSPKWRKRHERARHAPHVVRRLIAEYDYQFKFVVAAQDDCREVEIYLEEFPEIDRCRAMLMPQGVRADELQAIAAWLEPYCAQAGFIYCPRRQIEWFGAVRGT